MKTFQQQNQQNVIYCYSRTRPLLNCGRTLDSCARWYSRTLKGFEAGSSGLLIVPRFLFLAPRALSGLSKPWVSVN